ncbi:MAG TPA: HmuY family protein [Gemmatimonadales bacterium]
MFGRSPTALPLPLVIVASTFGAAIVVLLGASLIPRDARTYDPLAVHARADGLAEDTATIDARDEAAWRFFSFARGALAAPDTAGWDLAFRRYHVLVSGGAQRADSQAFERLAEAPAGGYAATVMARDTVNPAIERWYRYSMFSHLLRPAPGSYVIRTRAGHFAKLQFLSYYCPGPEAGCVTFRYVYQESDSRVLHSGGGR